MSSAAHVGGMQAAGLAADLAARLHAIAAVETIPAAELRDAAAALFAGLGLSRDDAATAADAALYAQLAGSDSHGLVHLPLYVTGLLDRTIQPRPAMKISRNGTCTARIDAGCGLGLVVSHQAMALAVELAGQHGLGAVAVRNSSHFGAAGYYGDLAARRGMIGIAVSNSAPAIAPTGGVTALLGTNPIGVGVPIGDGAPMVLDMATAMVARSRIRQMLAAGQTTIPEGWAIDPCGTPTTDAAAAIAGSVLPIGGPKGFGLALLVELLSSALADGPPGFDITYENVVKRPSGTGHFFLAINPAGFAGTKPFAQRAGHIAGVIETSRGRAGGPPPRLPGRRSGAARDAGLAQGIAPGPNLRAALQHTAALLERRRDDIADTLA
jgi:LDH2 family malate/lactate/ureidoglycolate dehydrogenase